MSEEFNVGDVVVCVDATSPAFNQGCMPTSLMLGLMSLLSRGKTYRVERISDYGSLVMVGIGWPFPYKGGYSPRRFKKLPKATDEFTRQMRACRPNKSRQPA